MKTTCPNCGWQLYLTRVVKPMCHICGQIPDEKYERLLEAAKKSLVKGYGSIELREMIAEIQAIEAVRE